MSEIRKYYNSGNSLGIVGTYVSHRSGDHSYVPSLWGNSPWIRTEDLYDTYEEAQQSPPARFLGEEE